MSRRQSFMRSLQSDARGATIVEFAMVAPILLITIMGLSDLCYRSYVSAILNGAVQKAGRDSTLETANTGALDATVLAAVQQIAKNATLQSTRRSYATFSNIKPEDYTDSNSNGTRDAGECYTDTNNNSNWDADGGNTGQGGADDVVVYEATVQYPRMFPLAKLIGWSANETIKSKTMLKNQPFASQAVATPVARCAP